MSLTSVTPDIPCPELLRECGRVVELTIALHRVLDFPRDNQRHRSVVAVVALNNIGASPHRPVVVVHNDNGRSYAPTAGALALHLRGLRRAPKGTGGGPRTSGPADHRNFFENLGFRYLGPVDGHDVTALEAALGRARTAGRPVVVHAVTVRGMGYGPAETAPVVNLGLPPASVSHGTRAGLLKATGLHAHGIVHSVLRARAERPLDTTPSPLWSA